MNVNEFDGKTVNCDFCKDTGFHLCPDVVPPILIICSKKDCIYGAARETIKLAEEIAKPRTIKIIGSSK